jgi:hypothetical protein
MDLSLFRKADLNTIVKLSYEPGSNFTKLVDSVTITNNFGQDSAIALRAGEQLVTDNDYIIKIPATNNTYAITNYQYQKANCKCGNDRYNALSGFSVNGVDYKNDEFQPSR